MEGAEMVQHWKKKIPSARVCPPDPLLLRPVRGSGGGGVSHTDVTMPRTVMPLPPPLVMSSTIKVSLLFLVLV